MVIWFRSIIFGSFELSLLLATKGHDQTDCVPCRIVCHMECRTGNHTNGVRRKCYVLRLTFVTSGTFSAESLDGKSNMFEVLSLPQFYEENCNERYSF